MLPEPGLLPAKRGHDGDLAATGLENSGWQPCTSSGLGTVRAEALPTPDGPWSRAACPCHRLQ